MYLDICGFQYVCTELFADKWEGRDHVCMYVNVDSMDGFDPCVFFLIISTAQ